MDINPHWQYLESGVFWEYGESIRELRMKTHLEIQDLSGVNALAKAHVLSKRRWSFIGCAPIDHGINEGSKTKRLPIQGKLKEPQYE